MGIIKRQGIKRAAVGYVGTAIGAISTLWIYPLDAETYGLIRFILGLAAFLMPFAALGVPNLTVRFFPTFEDTEHKHNGFLGFLLVATSVSLLIFLLASTFLRDSLMQGLDLLNFDAVLFEENFLVVALICVLMVFSQIFMLYASNFRRIVVPGIFQNLLPKIGIPILVLLAWWGFSSTSGIREWLVVIHVLILAGLAAYLLYLGQFSLTLNLPFLKKDLIKRMRVFAFYGILGGLGAILAFRIDSIMVASLVDLKSNGIYNIALFISNAIAIPLLAIEGIASPIISSAWKNGNKEEIKTIYTKSSLTLLITGLFLFLGVWSCLEDLFRLTPSYDVLIQGKGVVLFLGIAQVINMTTGVNTHIITHSPLFRYNLLLILFLAALNVGTNYWLIPEYGLVGAAMATALSLTLYNLAKYSFIWWKFGLQPFRKESLYTLLLGGLSFLIIHFFPSTGWALPNIILKLIILGLSFLLPIVYFNLSEDLNGLLQTLWYRLKGNRGKNLND
jgi:O-antigen/teichoic acid export membrane protein